MGDLFKPSYPEPQPAAKMPDPESPEVQEARRKARLEASSRGGRASTVMTEARPEAYSGTKLGSA